MLDVEGREGFISFSVCCLCLVVTNRRVYK